MKNLKKAMIDKGITVTELLELGRKDGRLDCTLSTLYAKIRGDYEFTVAEAVCISEILESDLPLADLFYKGE